MEFDIGWAITIVWTLFFILTCFMFVSEVCRPLE